MANFNPKNPSKYRGTDKYIAFFVTRNRRPLGADYRQPETGNLYSIGTIWQVGKDPSTGSEGDMFILTKIVSNVAFWEIFSGSSGTVIALQGNTGGPINPDNSGIINLIGDGSTVDIVGTPLNNTLTVSTSGSIASSYSTDSGIAVPISGILNINGGQGNATTGSTNVVTINAPTYTTDSGIATASSNTVHFVGGSGITTSATGSTVTITNTFSGTTVMQVFTMNGTYTPTTGMQYCIVEVIGGGGGGGGAAAASAGHSIAGGGGGAGEYARGVFSSGTIGVSQTVTIGAGGVSNSSGGTTSLGALITAIGGSTGASGSDTLPSNAVGGLGGTGGSGGTFRTQGSAGSPGFGIFVTNSLGYGGNGGGSVYGGAGLGTTGLAGSVPGGNGTGYGAGGGGSSTAASNGASVGGTGSAGVVIITEFL